MQLNLTEKGLRKMMEMSKSYRHALLNADVLDTFKVLCIDRRYHLMKWHSHQL